MQLGDNQEKHEIINSLDNFDLLNLYVALEAIRAEDKAYRGITELVAMVIRVRMDSKY